MAAKSYLNVDLCNLYKDPRVGASGATLFWGDEVAVLEEGPPWTKVQIGGDGIRFAKGKLPVSPEPPLRVSFIDVGQGDAAMIETPDDKRVLIDAGEEKFLARYLAAKFSATQEAHFDVILITHGDADHFAGLPILVDAASHTTKRISVTADLVLHNGLVKMAKGIETAKFGMTQDVEGKKFVVELFDDPRQIAQQRGNVPFRVWAGALDELDRRLRKRDKGRRLEVRRASASAPNPFTGLSRVTQFEVLGPSTTRVGKVDALPFLRASGRYSASHTINGNSVVLKVTHGPWRLLFCGDSNKESEQSLVRQGEEALRAEVFKVPHHGSADFDEDFLAAVQPLVSVVSTGTTSARKEYLHPRANLISALGAAGRRVSREPKAAHPIIFVTRLAGGFEYQGPAIALQVDRKQQPRLSARGEVIPDLKTRWFYGLTRESYGIVHVRCDEKRLLVVRHGLGGNLEPYAYRCEEGRYYDDRVTCH